MTRRPPRSTRTDTLFPYRRSSDLPFRVIRAHIVKLHIRLLWRTFRLGIGNPVASGGDKTRHSHDICQMALAVPAIIFVLPTRHRVAADHIDIFLHCPLRLRSEEHTSELQSLMRISYAVFCLKTKNRNESH